MKRWLLLALLPVISIAADTRSALADYVAHCDAAGRKVWNVSLCAPVVVVAQDGSIAWSSESVPTAPLPATRANTSFDWGDRKWVMLLAPLPDSDASLRRLVYHESFHVHQASLGLPDNMAVAAHLESEQARVSMRLEWAALERALASKGSERKRHVEQALAFRAQRINATALNDERAQMRHEGLAEYTGTVLSGDANALAIDALRHGNDRPSFARSFAYVSGPAWGLLLDAYAPKWKASIAKTNDDLPDLLPLRPATKPTPALYGGDAITGEEHDRAIRRKQIIDDATQRTSEANGLHLPLAKIQLDFDPNRVTPMPDGSQVYDKIKLTSDWGTIQVDGAPLRIAKEWNVAYVPWPLPAKITLTLADGWKAERGPDGRMSVTKAAPR